MEHPTSDRPHAAAALGRAVLDELLESHRVAPQRIIAATRQPAVVDRFAQPGVAVRRADFDDPADLLAQAFSGADRTRLISTDAPSGARLAQRQRAIDAAVQAGDGRTADLPRADCARAAAAVLVSRSRHAQPLDTFLRDHVRQLAQAMSG